MCYFLNQRMNSAKKKVTAMTFGVAVVFMMIIKNCEETAVEPPLLPKTSIIRIFFLSLLTELDNLKS